MNVHSVTLHMLARALNGRIEGNQVRAPSPGAGEKDDSLVVTVDPQRGYIVHSHYGMPFEVCRDYVDSRLGLPAFRDGIPSAQPSFTPKPAEPKPAEPYWDGSLLARGYRQIAAYDYTDAEGSLLYQVVRYEHATEKKTFLQRSPDGSGGWLKGAGKRKVLYRWPDVARAVHDTVFVTEGEKDADRLAALGFVATTVASGKWSDDVVRPLAGKLACILEDNDEAGRKRALAAAEALSGIAAQVRIVRLPCLPEGGDVSDWLDEDPCRSAQLVDIAAATPLWAPAQATLDQVAPASPERGVGPAPIIIPRSFDLPDRSTIPPRRWIYGRQMIRQFVSVTVSAGGIGKSSMLMTEAVAIVTGRDLLGIQPDESCAVWYWNGEDPYEELQRRLLAIADHYGVHPSDLRDRLYVNSGRDTRLVVAKQVRTGVVVMEPVVEAVKRGIADRNIGLLIIDPFVMSHEVVENDNPAINLVMDVWRRIADETNCAVELVHHSRKTNGQEVTDEDARGGSAQHGAARSMRALNRMSIEEAEKFGIEHRRQFFRTTDGKLNLAPGSDKSTWYELISVDIGNGTHDRPSDKVGVVTRWTPPSVFADVEVSHLKEVQKRVNDGVWRADPQAHRWVGNAVAAVLGLDIENRANKARIKALLRTWIANDVLREVERQDEARRVRRFVEVGEWA